MAVGPTKRNIVDGVDHMGSIYRAMPVIAQLIEAEYKVEDLEKAFKEAMRLPDPDDPLPEDHDGYGVWWTNWTLKGKQMNFTICFEKHEGYFGWDIRCPDEETYLKIKAVLSPLLSI